MARVSPLRGEHLDQVLFQASTLQPACQVHVLADLRVMQQGETVGAIGSEILRRTGDQLLDEVAEAQKSQVEQIRSCSDLSSYVSRDVDIRFLFDTVDDQDNGDTGWMMDDIEIRACPVFDQGRWVLRTRVLPVSGTILERGYATRVLHAQFPSSQVKIAVTH